MRRTGIDHFLPALARLHRTAGSSLRGQRVLLGISVGLFATVFLLAFGFTGVGLSYDSGRYISGVDSLFRHTALDATQKPFIGYIAVLALAREWGVGLAGVIVLQIVVAALAAVALFALAREFITSVFAVLPSVLYLAGPDNARWHLIVMTDSLFTALLILATWSVYYAAGRSTRWYLLASILTCTAASLRPNGWFLVPVAVLYWVAVQIRMPKLRLASMALVVGVCGLGGLLVKGEAGFWTNYEPTGTVVASTSHWMVSLPQEPPTGSHFDRVAAYRLRVTAATLTLWAARVGAELIRVRPEKSLVANVLLLVYVVPIYGFAAIGVVRTIRRRVSRLLLLVVSVNGVPVALVAADFSGRYLAFALPFIFIFVAAGLEDARERLSVWHWFNPARRRTAVTDAQYGSPQAQA